MITPFRNRYFCIWQKNMRKLATLLVLLTLCGAAWAASTPPTGSNGDIQYNNNGQWGPYSLGNGLGVTTSGGKKFLNSTATGGGTIGGVFPQLQYNPGTGSLGGLSNNTIAAFAAHDTVMNGLAYDPRNKANNPGNPAICHAPDVFTSNGSTLTYNYTIPFVGTNSTDNTNFYVYVTPTVGIATILTTSDFSVTGVNSGSGGTITLNVAPANGSTITVLHDDSAGILGTATLAAASAGYVSAPDNCYIRNMTWVNGGSIIGQGFNPNYLDSFQKPIWYTISPVGHAPSFGIDLGTNSVASAFFEGFEISGQFLDGSVLIGTNNGAGGGRRPGIVVQYMTLYRGTVGFGAPVGGNSSYIFAASRFNNYMLNGYGVYGPVTDFISLNDNVSSSQNSGFNLGPQQGAVGISGGAMIEGTRFEFNNTGVTCDSCQIENFDGVQFDGNGRCGLDLRGAWANITVTGGWFHGNANGGFPNYRGNTTAGQDAHICGNGTSAGGGGLHVTGANFLTNFNVGNTAPLGSNNATTPPYVLDITTTGADNNNIQIENGEAWFSNSTTGNNASVTDFAIYRNGKPSNLKIDLNGQAVQGKLVNGNFTGQVRGLPSNQWTGIYVFGDATSNNNGFLPQINGWGGIVAKQMGIGPTYYVKNDFSHFDCDVVNEEIAPLRQPNNGNNIPALWMPTASEPTWGGGFYQAHLIDNLACHLGADTWITVPQSHKTYAQALSNVTTSGAWVTTSTYGSYGQTTNENGDTMSLTTTTYGGPIYLWYYGTGNDGGTFTYNLDGGPNTTLTTQGQNQFTFPISSSSHTLFGQRIPASPVGSHTVNIAVTSTTSSSNNVTIFGIGTPPRVPYSAKSPILVQGGQWWVNNTYASVASVFNTAYQTQAAQLLADGLGVLFANTLNYFNYATDVAPINGSNSLDNLAQLHAANAFLGILQPVRNVDGSIDPMDYGAACNTQMYNGQGAAPTWHVLTTAGSGVIQLKNTNNVFYYWQPGLATQSGGGDVGKRICISSFGNNVGPCTYIQSVDTAANTATVGLALAHTVTAGNGSSVEFEGYPSNPNDPSTAHDDSNAFNAAGQAAILNGGKVHIPTNCMVHGAWPVANVLYEGNNGGIYYGQGSISTDRAAPISTILWCGITTFQDDNPVCADVSQAQHGKLKDVLVAGISFPFLGFGNTAGTQAGLTGVGVGYGQSSGSLGAGSAFYTENVSYYQLPVSVGEAFGYNIETDFTASINGSLMSVTTITSNNMTNTYASAVNSYLTSVPDMLALGRTITGAGVPANTTITSVPPTGGIGTYGLSTTSTVSSESMKTVQGHNGMEFHDKGSEYYATGIAINGDFTDSEIDQSVCTGTFMYYCWYQGPNSGANFGNGGSRWVGGRMEETGLAGLVCDGCQTFLDGVDFDFNGGFNIVTKGINSSVQQTGGWMVAGGHCNTATQDKAQYNLGGSGTGVSVDGVELGTNDFGSTCGGSTTYLFSTATGATLSNMRVSVTGGLTVGGIDGTVTNLFNWTNGTPFKYKQNTAGWPIIDNTQTVLSASSTGAVGIGTATPTIGTSLDLLSNTTTTNSTMGLPNHTTANYPTVGVTGMFGFNLTTTSPDFYGGGALHFLPSTTTVAPAPNYVLESTTTNGMGAQWLPVGTQTVLGSTTTPNPSITGAATSGLYATTTTAIGVQFAGTSVTSWTSAGQTTTGTINLAAPTWGAGYEINGIGVLSATTTATGLTAAGLGALPISTFNTYDTALGAAALGSVSNGAHNVGIGDFAGSGILTGAHNTAVGSDALSSTATASGGVITGSNNTAIGDQSMYIATAGANQNTAVGVSSLVGLTTGSTNVAVGYQAGKSITTGGNNIAIGPNVWSNGTGYTGSNNIMIGTTSSIEPSSTAISNALNIGNMLEGDLSIFHFFINGTVPTISSGAGDFGTAPAIIGNDEVGKVTIGSSPGGSGTITFANPWTNAPDTCSCNNNTTVARTCSALAITTTSFALSATTSPFTGADQLGYRCASHRL